MKGGFYPVPPELPAGHRAAEQVPTLCRCRLGVQPLGQHGSHLFGADPLVQQTWAILPGGYFSVSHTARYIRDLSV